jgi:DNA-binding NarL/FixJ family response regulator
MIDGVVGKVLVSSGSVVHSGEPMIEIVGEHRFVVAWFPVSRLYRLQVGDAVTVSTGGASLSGKIAKVSVIADALPEFQKAFAPIDGTRWLETSQRDIWEDPGRRWRTQSLQPLDCRGWCVKHFMRIRKRPDVARGAREAVTVVSGPCVGFYIANGGYSWAWTALALASISPPRLRALLPERGRSARRYPADALPFGMQYCLRKPRELPLMKILVVDDHALIREALHGVLRKLTRDAIILEASNCAQTMEAVASHPDIGLILLDLNLPDRDGFSMLAELREHNPAVSIVVLSAVQDRANVMKALDLGAMGYIPKSARNEVMLSALQLVFAGGIYIPPEILVREHLSHTAAPSAGGRAIVSPADLGLTDRQLDVLALMMQGKNNKSICRTLNLAEPTVKNHVTAILKALKVTNRTEAVIAVNELGWKLPATPKP